MTQQKEEIHPMDYPYKVPPFGVYALAIVLTVLMFSELPAALASVIFVSAINVILVLCMRYGWKVYQFLCWIDHGPPVPGGWE